MQDAAATHQRRRRGDACRMPPVTELLLFIVALTGAGVVAGILAGLFGIGGGAIIVPVLDQVMAIIGVDDAVRMHLAIGTSLAIIVPTSIRSYQAHRARGVVDEGYLKSWIVAVPVGAVLAGVVAAYSTSDGLRAIFAAIAIVVGTRMMLTRENWKLGDRLPGNPVHSIVGVVLGLLSGLMGIGGGVLNNTYMSLFGRPMHQAVGTSAGVGVLIALPGLFAYIVAGWGIAGLPILSTGYVNWIAVALLIPITVYVAPLGVGFAHRLSKRQLEIGFGLFLYIVAARFVAGLL
jgi:uncharacterized protein